MFDPGVFQILATARASCPTGKVALGGGWTTLDAARNEINTNDQPQIPASKPAVDGSGWLISYFVSDTSIVRGIRVYTTCATAG